MVPEELHIASLVIHSTPRRLESVAGAVAALPGALVHGSSANGKLVVTLEAPSAEAMTNRVSCLQRIAGVLSAALVYQCADSLDAMNLEVSNAQA
jgi:periplasmic nitrate reductase NapD